MKVSVYTRSGENSPSSYYRILQYANKWNYNTSKHIIVNQKIYMKRNASVYKKTKIFWNFIYYGLAYIKVFAFLLYDIMIFKPECVIVSREFSPKLLFKINEKLLKHLLHNCNNVIWDFDDDIFINKEISQKESDLLMKLSDTIIVTHAGLKSKLPVQQQEKTYLLPTTDGDFSDIKLEEVINLRKITLKERINLIWIATQSSISNLLAIIPELDLAAKELKKTDGRELILNVVCNCEVKNKTDYLVIKNITWSRDIIKDVMYNSHIGIMPLDDNEFNRGKGGFKIIQYMSTGMPVIASSVGFNNSIIKEKFGVLVSSKNEWKDIYKQNIIDIDKYEDYCYNSYNEYSEFYSFEKNLKFWEEIIRGIYES